MINKKLEIYSNEIPIEFLKKFFKVFPENLPGYFKNIPKKCPFSKFRADVTLKTCSGFINFYKKSIVFLSPYDIEYVIDNDRVDVRYTSFYFKTVDFHANNQFLDYVDNKKYLLISKLLFGIYVKSDIPLLVTNPTWALNDFEILPGILNAKPATQLNLFVPVKKTDKKIFIKQNTPLCIIHAETEKNIDVIFNNDKYDQLSENGLNYLFSNLKNRLLGNKFKIKK
jgi:hypothetical protein